MERGSQTRLERTGPAFDQVDSAAETALALATEQHDENAATRIRARREQYLNNEPTIQ